MNRETVCRKVSSALGGILVAAISATVMWACGVEVGSDDGDGGRSGPVLDASTRADRAVLPSDSATPMDTGTRTFDGGAEDAETDTSDSEPPIEASAPLCGPDTTILPTPELPIAAVTDSENVYWTSATLLMKAPLGGGTRTTLATGLTTIPNAEEIAVDSAYVYFTSFEDPAPEYPQSGAVMKVPIAGGTPITLASEQDYPLGLTVDSTNVYWVNEGSSGSDGSVIQMPLAGGPPTTLATGQAAPVSVVVDAKNVYWTLWGWTTDGGTSGAVMTAPIGGGAVSTLVSGGTGYGIAVDASNVYWTDFRAGNVMQMPLGGGAITTLASGQDGPLGFGVDADNVYFSNAMGQNVIKAPKGGGMLLTIASCQGEPSQPSLQGTNLYWVDYNLATVDRITTK
jgi:hypothetical protein